VIAVVPAYATALSWWYIVEPTIIRSSTRVDAASTERSALGLAQSPDIIFQLDTSTLPLPELEMINVPEFDFVIAWPLPFVSNILPPLFVKSAPIPNVVIADIAPLNN